MKEKLYGIIDIGGTKTLVVIINENSKILFREKRSTPKSPSPEELIALVEQVIDESGLIRTARFQGMGISMAGFIEHGRGLVHQSPNLGWDRPVPLRDLFQDKLKCPVLLENDTNSAVLGEACFGAARGHDNVIYITISTGIGGGLLLNGHLYRGASGFAGEIGHIKPFGKNRRCRCGGCDCLEAWASGSGIEESARAIWGNSDQAGQSVDTEWVFSQADQGNQTAQRIINSAARETGRGIANLVTLLNPSCIVIGGGVSSNRPEYLKTIIPLIRSNAISPSVKITKPIFVQAELEPESGIWGIYAMLTGRVEGI